MAAILMASRGTEGLPDIQGRFPAPGTHKIVWKTRRAGRIDRIWANRGHMEWAAREGLIRAEEEAFTKKGS